MNKKLSLLSLSAGALLALCGCNGTDSLSASELDELNKNVPQAAFVYQASTGLALIENNQNSSSSVSKMERFGWHTEITEEEEATIIDLLPQVDQFIEGTDKFTSYIEVSDVEGYNIKETVSYKDLTGELSSYTLYYTVEQEDTSADEEIDTDEVIDETVDTSTETDEVWTEEQPVLNSRGHNHYGNDADHHFEDYDSDFVISFVKGIAVVGENEYDFIAMNNEFTFGDYKSTEMTLRIFTGKQSYINIKQEVETDGTEYSEKYSYRIVENRYLVNAFTYKMEKDTEVDEDGNLTDDSSKSKLTIVLDNKEYKFTILDTDIGHYIRIRLDAHWCDSETITYVRSITTNEETGLTTTTYTELFRD